MPVFPSSLSKIAAPPLKCQGIKTKLVAFIAENISWNGHGTWIEPFVGSGCVPFNLLPQKALLCDTNHHLIGFYTALQQGRLTPQSVRKHLEHEGTLLEASTGAHYYEVRARFNIHHDPLDYLFLNRACFNGLVRFNRKGGMNVPFCKKPQRFSKAYITKIVNQVNWALKCMDGRQWEFKVSSWQDTLLKASPGDFVYLDPPYIGRHVDYFNSWSETESSELAALAQQLPCPFALSMWLENKYRRNTHLDDHWQGLEVKSFAHFYHLGSHAEYRTAMSEALVLGPQKTHFACGTGQTFSTSGLPSR